MYYFLSISLISLSSLLFLCYMSQVPEATERLSEVLTVLQLVFDGSFEVEGFDQGCLVQYQRVAHTVDVDALSRHPDTQLWHTEKTRRSKILL